MIRVLMVCTGNICRSPTAEGLMRHMVRERGLEDHFQIDSAGMIDYHVGEPPDPRSMRTARARGIEISDQRARQVHKTDFRDFDYLLAMDRGHQSLLEGLAPFDAMAEIRPLLSYLPDAPTLDVPDPYYGGVDGFEITFDLIERGLNAFLENLESDGRIPRA